MLIITYYDAQAGQGVGVRKYVPDKTESGKGLGKVGGELGGLAGA